MSVEIIETQVHFRMTIREAQSLLILLDAFSKARIKGLAFEKKAPPGVFMDIRDLNFELRNLLVHPVLNG